MRTPINLDARLLGIAKDEEMKPLPIFSGTGAAPRIDLESNAAMYAVAHADEDAAYAANVAR